MRSLCILCTAEHSLSVMRIPVKMDPSWWYRSPSNPAPDDEVSYSSEEAAIPRWSWIGGIVAAAAFCTAVLAPMLHMPFWEPLVAIVLALLVAVLAVR